MKPLIFEGRQCFLAIFHDITRRKMLEEQLHQSQKMEAVGTLAGGIAHDFNNILLAVFGYTELSLNLAEKDSALHRHLNNILVAGDRAKHLVHQILTFSRRTEQEFKPIQIKPIIKEALKLIRASLPSTISITHNIQSSSLILGDPTQIHQVLMNLCTNAGHAVRKQGGEFRVELVDEELDEKFIAAHLDLKPGPLYEKKLSEMLRLSKYKNLYPKVDFISTGTQIGFPGDDLHEAALKIIDTYGPERCVWGSNFPNVLWTPKMTYTEHLKIFTEALPLQEKARAQVLGETARRLWFAQL